MSKKNTKRKNNMISVDLVKRAEELKKQSENADLEKCIYILSELQEVLSETMVRIGEEEISQDDISKIYEMHEYINNTAKEKIKARANK